MWLTICQRPGGGGTADQTEHRTKNIENFVLGIRVAFIDCLLCPACRRERDVLEANPSKPVSLGWSCKRQTAVGRPNPGERGWMDTGVSRNSLYVLPRGAPCAYGHERTRNALFISSLEQFMYGTTCVGVLELRCAYVCSVWVKGTLHSGVSIAPLFLQLIVKACRVHLACRCGRPVCNK